MMVSDVSPPTAHLETTEDAFLGGRLTIAQARHGSRAGVDAVFLAAACAARPGETVLELGSGSGIVSLAIARRIEAVHVTGVEIDGAQCALAEANAARNALSDRTRFLGGDVTAPMAQLTAAGLKPDSFDHAVANPPYLTEGRVRLPSGERLRRAHALKDNELEFWVKRLATFLKPGGSVTLIHRADALGQLLTLCERRFGALVVFPLFPRQGAAASRILLQGRKGSYAPLRIAPGLILHGSGRDFTPEAEAILRHGEKLDLGW